MAVELSPEEQEQQEYLKHFGEAAETVDGDSAPKAEPPKPEPPKPTDQDPPPDPKPDPEPEPKPGDEPGEGGEGGEEPKGGAEPKPAPQAGAEDDKVPEWYKNLPKEAQEHLSNLSAEADRLRHADASNRGRVSALQRRLQTLEDTLQQAAEGKTPAAPEKKPDATASPPAGLTNEDWQTLQKDYPEIAKGVQAYADGLRGEIDAVRADLEQKVTPLQASAQRLARTEAESVLDQAHPDWREIKASEEFQQWVGQLSPARQRLLAQVSKSLDPYGVAEFMTDFKRDLLFDLERELAEAEKGAGPADPNAPEPKPGEGGEPPPDDKTIEQAAKRRQQQLEDPAIKGDATVGVKPGGGGNNYEVYFDAAAREIERQS